MNTNQIIMLAGWGAIFVLLAVGFFLVFRAASMIDRARINMNHLMANLRERKEATVKKTEAARRQYGSTSEDGKDPGLFTSLLQGIDNRLTWSGVSIERPWFNASVYITVTLVFAFVAFGILLVLVNWVIAAVAAGLIVILPFAYITFLTNQAYHNTEVQLKFFISLVSSNSSMAGDLVNVLEMAVPFVTSPIKGAILRAVSTARIKGDQNEAVWQLEREIEHPLFRSFIRNLDICSKNDGDFRSVAKDFSVQAEQSLAQLEKQRAIFANARNEVILMVGVGIALSFMSANFCERDLFEVLIEMKSSLIGIVILLLEIVIYLATLGYVLLGKKR